MIMEMALNPYKATCINDVWYLNKMFTWVYKMAKLTIDDNAFNDARYIYLNFTDILTKKTSVQVS